MEPVRKKIIIVSLIALLSGLCLGSSNQFSAEKKNACNAAKAFIGSIQERAKNRLVDSDQLVKMMTTNVAGHQDRTKSWDILQQEEKNNDLLGWYTKEVDLLLQGLNQKKPAGLDDFFTPEEKSAFLKCPDEVIKAYLNNNFGKSVDEQTSIFAKARKKACDLQLDNMAKDVYPTEEEVDTALNQNKVSDLGNKILEKLIKRQTGPIFSENIAALGSSFIEPVLKDAEEQFKRQGSVLSQSYGGSYVVPEDIASFIQNEIVQYQEALKKEKQGKTIASKVYNIFPSIKGKLAAKSSEIAIKRFRDSVADMTLSIDKDALKKMIRDSLSNHVGKDQSWGTCLKSLYDSLANKAIDAHAAKAQESKRTAFRQFLSSLIFNSDQSCKDAVSGLVEKSLRDSFDSIRKEISEEQFKEFFKPLEGGTWKPSEDEIDKWYNKTLDISEPLKMPGISSKAFDPADLFEETVEMVLQTEKTAINKDLSVLRNQMTAVDNFEAQIRKEVETTSPTVEKIIQSYTEKIKKDYPNLFKRVQDEIRRRARDILEAEIKRREAVVAQAAKDAQARSQVQSKGTSKTLSVGGGTGSNDGGDSKGPGGGGAGTGGGTGEGKGSGKEEKELGDEIPDVLIDFSYRGGSDYADIMFPKEEKRTGAKLKIESGRKRNLPNLLIATDVFYQWLKDVSQKAEPDQKEINVYVLARVFSGDSVLYSAVYYFRDCLIAALKRVGDERIKIHWYDQLFDEPDDIEKYQGKPILPPEFKKNTMPKLWTI